MAAPLTLPRVRGPARRPSFGAEAQACRLALEFLLDMASPGGRAAIFAGDSRLVTDHVRFKGRLGDARLQRALGGHIAAAELQSWTIRWFLLPRSTNDVSDRLARAERAAEAPVTHAWLATVE